MIQDNITAVVIVLSTVLAVAVALIVYLFQRLRRVEGEYELLTRGREGRNFVEIVNDNIAQVERVVQEMDSLSERYAWVLRRMAGSVQHVGVVRFDAFRDLGGLLSFAVALLDDRGNGLVLSSIYGRSESRTYAKPVVERGSSYPLSPEEKEAIRLAMQDREFGALPTEAVDLEHEERMANLKLFQERELLQPPPTDKPPTRPRRRPPPSGEPEEDRAPEPVEPPPRTGRSIEEPPPRRGRATHVGGTPRQRERRLREKPPGREARGSGNHPIDLVSDLEEKRAPERLSGEDGRPVERPMRRRANPPRSRGLDTPVERLRNRENRGD